MARWILRAVACAALLSVTACAAAAQPQRTARPNEVQVVEPAGRPDGWGYAPKELAVAKGTTVTFVNQGKELHTVTADAPNRPFDLSIDSNQTATITFDTVGVFSYHRGVHPQMKGVVRVCDGACG
ncbi:MAG TPA: cupredoxin domain-containing protein [Candidatus Limnocylindria bacterium]|nr:cupredoxin domain-containing protein [Candidatus Limnocylindria bacterium]